MKIHVRSNGGAKVLEIHGQIVGGSDADLLHSYMTDLVRQKIERVVLNLGHVRRINSCGAGILQRESQFLHDSGGTLKIAEASRRLNHVFFTIQLDQVIDIHDTEEDAIVSFYRSPAGAATTKAIQEL